MNHGQPDPTADDPTDPHAHAPWTDDETRRLYQRSLAFWRGVDPDVDLILDVVDPDA